MLGFAFCKRFVPDLEPEILGPAVEPLALLIGVQHRGRQPPIAQRQRALEGPLLGVVGLDVQILESTA